jgi:N-acyl-phosphatidylethanolamine-hydrolysing phospholipase D
MTPPPPPPPPHHAPGGRFRNPWPGDAPQRARQVVRVILEYIKRTRTSPQRVSLPVAIPDISYPRAERLEANATWIGHSTVLIQLAAMNVLTDPVFCQRAFPVQWFGPRRVTAPALSLDELPPIDVVLLSHNHYDHLDRAAARRIAGAHPRATWVVPLGLGSYLRRCGVRVIVELDWWQQASIGAMRVTATPARHSSARGLWDRNKTLWCGFAIEVDGLRAFFAGDTAYHPEFDAIGARCGPFDFVMIPIGAYEPRWFMQRVHVDPEEAVRIYEDLSSSHPGSPGPLMLCIHWGTYPQTTEPMDEPPGRVAARWREVGLDMHRLWVARAGETRTLTRCTV